MRAVVAAACQLLLAATISVGHVEVVAWPPAYLANTAGGAAATGQARIETRGAAANVLTPDESRAGWKLLFDGRSLEGWNRTGDADWTVTDRVLTFSKGRGMLISSQTFGNFALSVEFMGEKTANSGVFLRCPAASTGLPINQVNCYEVNIFDPHETAPTGSIVSIQSVLPERPATAGRWNVFEILAEGNHLVVKLNGKTTVDTRDEKLNLVSGAIALQAGGPGGPGPISFRNIKVRPL